MKSLPFITIVATAGIACANPITGVELTESFTQGDGIGITTTVDLTGISFNDEQGSAINEILSVFLPSFAEVIGIGWDINLTTIGASWASEATMSFQDQVLVTPGIADGAPVSNQNYNSEGIIDLTDSGLSNISLAGDGILHIEFFETFIDNAGSGDAFLEPGSVLYIRHTFPTPTTLAALGFGGLITARRRR